MVKYTHARTHARTQTVMTKQPTLLYKWTSIKYGAFAGKINIPRIFQFQWSKQQLSKSGKTKYSLDLLLLGHTCRTNSLIMSRKSEDIKLLTVHMSYEIAHQTYVHVNWQFLDLTSSMQTCRRPHAVTNPTLPRTRPWPTGTHKNQKNPTSRQPVSG